MSALSEANHILIVYASQSGSTTALAQAVRRGAQRGASTQVRMLHGVQAGIQDLLWCDALVFATPENFGYMAGAVKDFLDRTYHPAQGRVDRLPYAVVVSAGNDGRSAIEHLQRIARGFPLEQVAEPIRVVGEVQGAHLEACEGLGEVLSAGLELGIHPRPRRRGVRDD